MLTMLQSLHLIHFLLCSQLCSVSTVVSTTLDAFMCLVTTFYAFTAIVTLFDVLAAVFATFSIVITTIVTF
jgi:hypothetical protein